MKFISSLLSLSVLFLSISLSGCAGKTANLVTVNQYGDAQKSCAALEQEMIFAQEEINRRIPQTDKTGKNVALGIAGWFLIVPWFFMDLSKAEQLEIDQLRLRYNHLAVLAINKNCAAQAQLIPDFADRKAFEAYQADQQTRLVSEGKMDKEEMTLEEARAKVAELEGQAGVPQPKN